MTERVAGPVRAAATRRGHPDDLGLVRRTGVLMVPRPPLTIDRAVRDHAAPQVVAVDLAHEPLAPALEQARSTPPRMTTCSPGGWVGFPGDAEDRQGRGGAARRRA